MIITIDGPCGSGKSTIAQLLAQKLGFFYLNSGYLYRAVAYILIDRYGYDLSKLTHPNFDDVAKIIGDNNFVYFYQDGKAGIQFYEIDITDYLKSAMVSDAASLISSYEKVRNLIVPLQQKLALEYNLVTDGRDCGTQIYPNAHFKFYMTASLYVRALRLHQDLIKKGIIISFEQVMQDTIARDTRDTQRLICPLKKATDAIEIDSSDRSIGEILAMMSSLIHCNEKLDSLAQSRNG